MDVLYDITISLISSSVYFILGVIAHKVFIKFLEYRRYTIWKTFNNKNDLGIRLSIRPGPFPTSTPRTSVAEVTALAELLPIFKKMGIKAEIATESAEIVFKHYQNILAIGGPTANDVTANLIQKYDTFLPIKLVENPIGFEVGNKKYAPIYSSDGSNLVSDYALLALFQEKKPDKNYKTNLIVMGCRGIGTQGCISSIQSKELIDLYKNSNRPKSFVAIVKVDVKNDELCSHIVEFFPLLLG